MAMTGRRATATSETEIPAIHASRAGRAPIVTRTWLAWTQRLSTRPMIVAVMVLVATIGTPRATAATNAVAAHALQTVAALKTTVTVYEPFAARGAIAPYLHVVGTDSGSCNGDSENTSRIDAWRCFGGNSVYDPCFQDLSGYNTALVCPSYGLSTYGLSTRVVLLRLTAPLPAHFGKAPPSQGLPLGLTLSTGEQCTILGSGTTAIGDLPLRYFGGNSNAPTVLVYGGVDRSRQPYTALVYRTRHGWNDRPTLKQLVRTAIRSVVL